MNNNINFPSPAQLAKKEETKVTSLRVKQSTLIALDELAKSYGTNTSALINGILDSYVEQYSTKIGGSEKIRRIELKQSILDYAANLSKFSDDEILPGFLKRESDSMPEGGDLSSEELVDYLKYQQANPHSKEAENAEDIEWLFCDEAHSRSFLCEVDRYGTPADATFYYNDPDMAYYCTLRVAPSQWPLIVSIIDRYINKNYQLYGDSRSMLFDAKTFEKIAAIAKSDPDRATLAKKVAETLVNFKGVDDE